MKMQNSIRLFEEAQKYLCGGVNSPVRAFKAVGMTPLFMERAQGSKIYDVDGNEYVDYVGSWGPMILGHAHPEVVSGLKKAAERGTSYGAPTELEVELAKEVTRAFPSMEQVRMVSSGTEAAMTAIRLARGYTGRDRIIKFEGCYHGHADSLLVKAGSGATTFGIPDSKGVPGDFAQNTLTATFNDLQSVERLIEAHHGETACIIVEPIAGNMGVIPPEDGFLEGLRAICDDKGIVLIFDEVITGFRVSYGGAQDLYGVRPDLTCLGKVIGGGLPVGAFGGRKEIMERLAPSGDVYQAGTLSGNPIAMTAGLITLRILRQEEIYEQLAQKSDFLCNGVREIAEEGTLPFTCNQVGAMATFFFTEGPVRNFSTAKRSDTTLFSQFFSGMLSRFIYIAPSQFEALFLSLAHTEDDLGRTLEACRDVFREISAKRKP
jgi:glutamate-1-semialdehyde 2,1-aminomutase